MKATVNLFELSLRTEEGEIRAIIETPKGHRNKYKYERDGGYFELGGVLSAGHVFPFDFGFFPSTMSEDGDALDVLVLMDEPAYPGCVLTVELIGVIEARQKSKKEDVRNDRLIAVHTKSHLFRNIDDLHDLPKSFIEEISHFFVSYNEARGSEFIPLAIHGHGKARQLLEEAAEMYQQGKRA